MIGSAGVLPFPVLPCQAPCVCSLARTIPHNKVCWIRTHCSVES